MSFRGEKRKRVNLWVCSFEKLTLLSFSPRYELQGWNHPTKWVQRQIDDLDSFLAENQNAYDVGVGVFRGDWTFSGMEMTLHMHSKSQNKAGTRDGDARSLKHVDFEAVGYNAQLVMHVTPSKRRKVGMY